MQISCAFPTIIIINLPQLVINSTKMCNATIVESTRNVIVCNLYCLIKTQAENTGEILVPLLIFVQVHFVVIFQTIHHAQTADVSL